jgi:hypothetical protein
LEDASCDCSIPEWEIRQWDVVAAYLQADLDPRHKVYIEDTNENGEREKIIWNFDNVQKAYATRGYEAKKQVS